MQNKGSLMENISTIKNYILYLKKECNLSVTLHAFHSDLFLKSDLLAFNIHENPYCIHIKSCAEAHEQCIQRQKNLLNQCKDVSFIDVCYAGVKEYVYPVTHNQKVIGFICVSGYMSEKSQDYILEVSKNYPLTQNQLFDTYNVLSNKMPEKAYVDTLVYPLCQMLELLHFKNECIAEYENTLIHKIVHYIKMNFTKDITSKMLCDKFQCSRSHLSHSFNQVMKTDLRTYINNLRIQSAKTLLRDTKLEINEISLSVGFFDPNYFTSIFKKYTGITPSAYRNFSKNKKG